MEKAIIEAYNELMKVNVNGEDVEHMYNALARLAAVINAMRSNAPEANAPEANAPEANAPEMEGGEDE